MSRCNCLHTIVIDPPPSGNCANCLQVASVLVPCINSIGPCEETGTIDLTEYNDYSACTCGDVVYQIISVSPEIDPGSVTITDDIISFTTYQAAAILSLNEYAEIKYRVSCPCDTGKGTLISSIGVIKICIKNRCMYTTCITGDCDPCTGSCS